jgi:hypothetical protein
MIIDLHNIIGKIIMDINDEIKNIWIWSKRLATYEK